MTPAEAIDIGRDAVVVMLQMATPVLLVALFVGVAIALVQALTQIQEMTLTFVPKILAIFASLIFLMPFMLSVLTTFTHVLADRIIAGGP
ncbi:flagellar biosynthesis protein FliQ [Fodinicurvata sp. EGI_FJ10296]|uniref:flagellar biosynthesis protein FliQ n=1 Tax=Fodinicurvata sp. EGI_FJ10296 TaxID=3231908 RepID=UPI0034536612